MIKRRLCLFAAAAIWVAAASAPACAQVQGGGSSRAATTARLGDVKCDGTTTTCAADGTITATAGGSAGINQLSGDVTAGPGSGSVAATVGKIGGNAVAIGGALSFSGAFTTTITVAGNTAVTLPTAGTLATLAGSETFTNKTLTSPIFTAPVLGTPASGILTNATGYTVGNLSGAGTGVLTALGINVGSAGAPVLFNGAGGTPSSLALTSATGLPLTTGVTGILPVANGGSGIASGTSGGVLAYTASGTLASSAALTANLPVIGGGAGVAPTVGTRSGNTTAYVTTTGAQTSGDCVKIDANGNHIANGSACGGGGTPVVFVGATAGAANTYTIASPTPTGFTLTDQFIACGSISAANTGASTLNVNSTGATAIKKQTSAGLAALAGGELAANNTQYCFQYNSAGTAFVLQTNLASGVAQAATSTTVTAVQWANWQVFDFQAAAQTLTLPVVTGLAANGGIIIKTEGNPVTLAPNGADGINGGTIGTSVTIPANFSTVVTTSGASGTTAVMAPLGLVAGSNITLTANSDGTTTVAASGAGGSTLVAPQGRLTLVSQTPIMSSDQTAKTTIYYDNYVGNKVPYYTGSADALDTIAGGEVSLTMVATNNATGEINASDVFDVWWVNTGANRICLATSAGASANGAGWLNASNASSITARSTTTGFNALDYTTRPYITNKNALTNCYNGATNYGSVPVNQATYLGSIYTTAAGQTSMVFSPASASGGSNTFLGLYNAYNRVTIRSLSMDSTTSWTYTTASWRAANASNSNRISWLDGLARSLIKAEYSAASQTTSNGGFFGVGIDSTTSPTGLQAAGPGATASFHVNVNAVAQNSPLLGLHFAQAIEFGATGLQLFGGGGSVLFLEFEN